jgi:hypothetical protein
MLVVLVGMPMFLVIWQEEPVVEAAKRVKLKTDSTINNTTTTSFFVKLNTKSDTSNGDNDSNQQEQKADQPPSMVWLMSFPNSGTSYTMRMVSSASNTAVATNYGPEALSSSPVNIPLYSTTDSAFEGPFWNTPQDEKAFPKDYVLTKTHCGGRCGRCSPNKYVLSLEQFMRECSAGTGCQGITTTTDGNSTATSAQTQTDECKWTEYQYASPPHNPRLQKMIHLIRNPFDNLASRFHLAVKNTEKRMADNPEKLNDWLQQHPRNATGFDNWCRYLDNHYGSPLLARKAKNNTNKNVSLTCQGEWYKYIQWHTLALQTIQTSGLPSLTIYYEEYEQDWNATVHKILDFLNLGSDISDQVLTFQPGKHYDDHYTAQQRIEARSLVQQFSSKETWDLLKRYF